MALGLAVYASPPALPLSTQDSLLAVGQTLPDGIYTRRVTIKGFRFQFTSLPSSFAKLLGAIPFACPSMKVLIDAAYEGLPTNQVQAFMDWEPVTIKPDTQLFSIIQSMINNNRRRLPVLDGTRLVGQISRRDIMRQASKILCKKGDRESTLLYVSALREMQDTPVRVKKSR